jgi:hypothetical protein
MSQTQNVLVSVPLSLHDFGLKIEVTHRTVIARYRTPASIGRFKWRNILMIGMATNQLQGQTPSSSTTIDSLTQGAGTTGSSVAVRCDVTFRFSACHSPITRKGWLENWPNSSLQFCSMCPISSKVH